MASNSSASASASRSRDPRPRPSYLRWLTIAAMLVPVLTLFAEACVVEDTLEPAPPIGKGGGTSSGKLPSTSSGGDACVDGTWRDCHVTLGQHDGILSCYDGKQYCFGGEWTDTCVEGSINNKIAPPSDQALPEGQTPLALSDAGPCTFNPCDPTCQYYDELPDGGFLIDGSSNTPWQTANPAAFNLPGVAGKGVKSPCFSGGDCQFNQYCYAPDTLAACAHNVCATGTALLSTCDDPSPACAPDAGAGCPTSPSCVAQICTTNPGCCFFPTPCAHDICVTGTRLNGCADPCATAICGVDPYCCTTFWDNICVGEVASVCGQTCPSWSQTCVDAVHDVCGAECAPAQGTCAHDRCLVGDKLTSGCDNPTGCVAQVCAARPSCCTTAWDSTCVSLLPSACGVACPPLGQCKPWLAGQTDPDCPSQDFTVGTPCGVDGGASVPVCNIGPSAVDAGVTLGFYPANSYKLPSCNPGAGITMCPPTTQQLLPGQCVDVLCPGITGNQEIIVNPPGAGQIPECQCNNNWAIGTGATCENPNCTGAGANVRSRTPQMYFLVERSSAVSASDWTKVQNALAFFFNNNTEYRGAHANLAFYPDNNAFPSITCNTSTCNTATCGPRVYFPYVAPNYMLNPPTGLAAVATATAVTALGAPTYPAFRAGMDYATTGYNNQSALIKLGTQPVMVLIMASESNPPMGCGAPASGQFNLISSYAASQRISKGIRTFVIGISPGVSQSTIDTIAIAGGTQAGYLVNSGPNLQSELQTALRQVRINTYQCYFDLPPPGAFDPSNPTVTRFPPGVGANVTLTQVTNLAACGASQTSYYYDNNISPTRFILCPKTCEFMSDNPGYNLQYKVNCPKNYQNSSFQEDYTASCPPGTRVQWGYLAYQAITLGGSSVDFIIQTGPSTAMLGAPINVAHAQATPTNTQVCALGGPSPCPIDLFTKLGGPPAANDLVLRLQMQLNSNIAKTITPIVQNWQITYSCPPSE